MNEIQFLIYEAHEKIEVAVKDDTIWATQKAIAALFDVGVPSISKHLKNIFESGELNEKVVVSILENTTQHGAIEGKMQTKDVKFYNLDAIIVFCKYFFPTFAKFFPHPTGGEFLRATVVTN
jgi:hypothetical protein